MQKTLAYEIPKNLLSKNNFKTVKGEKYGYLTYILYMSPYKDNSKGKNICAYASKGCAAACLVGSGFGGMYEQVKQGRRNKTEYYLANKTGFMNQLVNEISNLVSKNDTANLSSDIKKIITFRLNGTSDIPYENIIVKDGKNVFQLFPDVQFYDYTKNWKRFYKELPINYHLTFSRAENNESKVFDILGMGFNVAVVFDRIPKEYKGYKVVNGDESDLRFKDGTNVIVGLKYKMLTGKGANNKQNIASDFVVKVQSTDNKIAELNKKLNKLSSLIAA